jgi:hypothetical protein
VQKAGDGSYKDGEGRTLTLRDDQVTNNLRIAREAAGSDVRMQAALRQAAAQREALERTQRAKAVATPVPVAVRNPVRVPAPEPPQNPSNIRGLGAKSNDRDFTDANGVHHWKDGRGVWHVD